MSFREYIAEGNNKYTKGSWKTTTKAIINDFMGKEKELGNLLSVLSSSELKNIARNAAGYLRQEPDENIKNFLGNLIKTAGTQASKTSSKQNNAAPVTDADWKEFGMLIKKHDKYYQQSDDHSVFVAGDKSMNKINSLFNKLVVVDKTKAETMMKSIR